MTMPEITAELLDEATENVYARFRPEELAPYPEFECRQHGHGDCTFWIGGPCTGELIDQELGNLLRMRRERQLRAMDTHPGTTAIGVLVTP